MTERPVQLLRKSIAGWSNLHEQATWCTNLNDLRMMSGGMAAGTWQRTVLRELKLLCLFHGRRVVLADSDILNSDAFQQLFLSASHGDDIRFALRSGRIVLALRDTAAGLADLNSQQGPRRADPTMAERATPFAQNFDRFFHEDGLVTLNWDLEPSAASFASMLQRLIHAKASPLMPAARESLQRGMHAAQSAESGGRLLFGHIYDHLVRKESVSLNDPAIQAVRAAHMLNTSVRLGFSPSVALTDIDPAYALFVTTGKPASCHSVPSDVALKCPVPRRIMLDTVLDTIPFDRIVALQQLGDAHGYFAALERARAALGTRDFGERYAEFLEALAVYMNELAREARFELFDWQKSSLQQRLEAITADEQDRKVLVACCIPLAIVTAASTMLCMGFALPTGWLSAASFASSAAASVGAAVIGRAAEKQRARIKRLIEGSGTVPLAKLSA